MSTITPSLSMRRRVCDELAAACERMAPALAGKCFAAYSDEEVTKTAPSLRVLPRRLRFVPLQPVEKGRIEGSDDVVYQVGEWQGEVELQLAANHTREREEIEESIAALWQLDVDRAGVLVLPLPSAPAVSASGPIATSYSSIVSFFLDSDEWQEERVFTKKRDSLLVVDVEAPALAIAQSVPLINTIQLTLQRIAAGEKAVDDPSAIVVSEETIQIDEQS
jgi:hypothetical protein